MSNDTPSEDAFCRVAASVRLSAFAWCGRRVWNKSPLLRVRGAPDGSARRAEGLFMNADKRRGIFILAAATAALIVAVIFRLLA